VFESGDTLFSSSLFHVLSNAGVSFIFVGLGIDVPDVRRSLVWGLRLLGDDEDGARREERKQANGEQPFVDSRAHGNLTKSQTTLAKKLYVEQNRGVETGQSPQRTRRTQRIRKPELGGSGFS